MRMRLILLLALVLSLALAMGACGAMDDEEAVDDGTTDFGAAELRAELGAGFQGHAHLTGLAVRTVLEGDGDLETPAARAVIEALDASSRELADAIGSIYGDEIAEDSLESWREHDDSFVQYGVARATGDDAGAERAEQQLEDHTTAFGELLAEADEDLDAGALAGALDSYVEDTRQATDELVAGDDAAVATLRRAAAHMPGLAALLASAVVEQFPDQFPGDPDSPASELRSDLTAGLQEYEYLTALTAIVAVEQGGAIESEGFQAASGVLEESSVALADRFGSAYDDEQARERFLEIWRDHSTLFMDYALARITGEDAGAERAERGLDRFRQALGQLMADFSEDVAAEEIAEAAEPHVDATTTAIDSIAAGGDEAFEEVRLAAAEMPPLASTLSDAIAARFPDRLAGS